MKRILQSLVLLLAAMMMPIAALANPVQVPPSADVGDVNCDGMVNITDVTSLIDHLLGAEVNPFSADNADTNLDGSVNISDVTMLIDHLLSGTWPWNEPAPATETFTVDSVSFTMVGVAGGIFMMGAADDDTYSYEQEHPAHQVTLSSYSIGQTEVTQALWQTVMGSNPSHFKGNPQNPVEDVSWDDCQEFLTKLNELTGRTFRLPTEAEWEFAARGGNLSHGYTFAGSDRSIEVAWYNFDSNSTHMVATKAPNELGLYDMSGNVWEWVYDRLDAYPTYPVTNPTGPPENPITYYYHMIRGGSWYDDDRLVRVTCRHNNAHDNRVKTLGLRLAL